MHFVEMISGDSVEECSRCSLPGIKLGGLANQGHKRFLHDVSGSLGSPGHMQGETKKCALMAAIKLNEGRFVPGGQQPHQLNIAEFMFLCHYSGLDAHTVLTCTIPLPDRQSSIFPAGKSGKSPRSNHGT